MMAAMNSPIGMVAVSSAAILGKVNGPTHMEAKTSASASRMPDTR